MGNAAIQIADILIKLMLYFFTGNRIGQVAADKFTKIFRLCKRGWRVCAFFGLLSELFLLILNRLLERLIFGLQLPDTLFLLNQPLSQVEDFVFKIFQQYEESRFGNHLFLVFRPMSSVARSGLLAAANRRQRTEDGGLFSNRRSQLALEGGHQVLHCFVDNGVCQRLSSVLQRKAHGVGFLTCAKIGTFIHIKHVQAR
jgi:hypothetical protein